MWILGNHRLLCGDATSRADFERLMDGERGDLVLTDPPYGMKCQHKSGRVGGGWGGPGCRLHSKDKISIRCYSPMIGDDSTQTFRANFDIIAGASKHQIVWGGNFFTDILPPSRCWLVWDKQNGKTDFADAELAWTSFDKGVRLYQFLWNGVCRRGSYILNPRPRVHPTQKPVELHMDILNDYSKQGDVVIDCFGGSGTTLIACDQIGRKCRMMELSEEYCDIIVRRWQELHPLEDVQLVEP